MQSVLDEKTRTQNPHAPPPPPFPDLPSTLINPRHFYRPRDGWSPDHSVSELVQIEKKT